MGKASRRKHAEEQQRLYFDIKGDVRSAADRSKARAMLDALQQKLVDDALREDGFFFLDGKYTDARRPRFTPGMKSQTYDGHTRRITDVAVVAMDEGAPTSPDLNSFVVTFGTDAISVWNMKTGERIGVLDTSPSCAITICGAATRQRAGSLLWIGYATHLQPCVTVVDTETSSYRSPDAQSPLWDFSVGHQQQITCMSFNHGADNPLLATGSLDSTCIVWKIVPDGSDPNLKMLMILPVADAGVTSCVFDQKEEEIVTLGRDGTLKVWRIGIDDADPQQLHEAREDWGKAVPLTLTVAHTLDMLVFGDVVPSFHGNDDWVVHDQRSCLSNTDTLQVPQPVAQAGLAAEEQIGNRPLDAVSIPVNSQTQTTSAEGDVDLNRDVTSKDGKEQSAVPAFETLGDANASNQVIEEAVDEIERLRRVYEQMDSFDFQRILNPATPVLYASELDGVLLKSIPWPVVTPDADGRLLRTFTRRKANGDFAAHTSHVTGCAVAKGVDLVTTVSFDKSIICWSFAAGIVRSITRDAHSAPITSCALTSPMTSLPPDLPLMLATAAKDNLVKVWRFASLETCVVEAVYSLSGHYDAITTLCFDASGVFLLSAGDDTLAHCWRVRPAPPDAPPKPVVLEVDRFAITIKWKVPLANGSALAKYVVHIEQLSSLDPDGNDMKVVKDREVEVKYTTVTLDDLQPGIQYRLCVAAVNSVGHSLWSEVTDTVETLAFAPSKINKTVTYRDITATSVRLSWKAPCANGAVITSYIVKALPENALFVPRMEIPVPAHELLVVTREPEVSRRRQPLRVNLKKPKTKTKSPDSGPAQYEYVLHGLWPGEVYQFIVAAENCCGIGEFSPFSDYIKTESTAPDAPARPEITDVDKRHALVTWIKPRSNGSEILQYIIEWTQVVDSLTDDANTAAMEASRSSVTLLTKSILGTTYKITGLRPGCPLRVWVAATNLMNGKLTASPFSEPSETAHTLPDVPEQPARPRLESPSPHSIVVALDSPCDNGAPITAYQLAFFSEELQFGIVTKTLVRELELTPDTFERSPPDAQGNSPTSSTLRISMFRLRAKTFYSATVVAANALGRSKLSESSAAVATKAPAVPAVIQTSPIARGVMPTQATLSWAMPTHDGGAALASVVLQYSINDGAFEHEIVLFDGTELVLEQLKPRTRYAFRVAATNGVGRAAFSPACAPFTTPSLVDFTIATYFASRPPLEHAKATVLQRRFRLRKQRNNEQRAFLEQLSAVLAQSWHML